MAWVIRSLGLLKQRLSFESLNFSEPECLPFDQADSFYWAFHCSSEGEFEQLRPLMTRAIELDGKIELIFTSPSVERKVKQFYATYPSSVRYLRMPLVSKQRLKPWSKASGLIMCRYDFFPELLLMPTQKKVLVWASLKGKGPNPWLKLIYRSFDLVIASNSEQELALEQLTANMTGVAIETYDFRPLQIKQRLSRASLPRKLVDLVALQAGTPKLIVGSAWLSDFHLFEQLLKQTKPFHLWLAPHQLDQTSLQQVKSYWQQHFPEIQVISINLQHELEVSSFIDKKNESVIWVLESPGVLVELYSLFDFAYVGGGFGRSIHSVLEPAIAGCRVCCGPKIHRSTEIDLVNELSPSQISVVESASDLSKWWSDAQVRPKPFADDKAFKAVENWINRSDEIIGLALAH